MPSWSGVLAEVVGERWGRSEAEILEYLGHGGDGGGRGNLPGGVEAIVNEPVELVAHQIRAHFGKNGVFPSARAWAILCLERTWLVALWGGRHVTRS